MTRIESAATASSPHGLLSGGGKRTVPGGEPEGSTSGVSVDDAQTGGPSGSGFRKPGRISRRPESKQVSRDRAGEASRDRVEGTSRDRVEGGG
jgi:hypothetical protein